MDKTARELLEEAVSILTIPLLEVNGEIITVWETGDEFRNVARPAGKIMSPDLVDKNFSTNFPDLYSTPGVCAIGAIALASLSDSYEALKDRGLYRVWTTQANYPQVALATIALFYALKELKGPKWWESVCVDRKFFSEMRTTPLSEFVRAANTDVSALTTNLAKNVVSYVTDYNDQHYYQEVIALFQSGIKLLIEAEAAA